MKKLMPTPSQRTNFSFVNIKKSHTKICTLIFTGALWIIAKKWKQSKYLSLMDKQNVASRQLKIFSNEKKVLIHSLTWMNLENMLSERSQSKKTIFCMNPFIWNVHDRQIYTDRKISGCQGWEIRHRKQGVTAHMYRSSFEDNENVLKLIEVTVVQLYEYSKNPELYTLK